MKIIPSFEEFLFESLKSDKRILELNHYLNLNRQRGADGWQWCQIPVNWDSYDKFDKVDKTDMGPQSACYENALQFSKDNPEYDLVIGVFIYWDDWLENKNWMNQEPYNKFNPWAMIYPHAFNLTNDGKIYDITIDNSKRNCQYVGIKVDPSKFSKGFGELDTYLIKLLDIQANKKGIEKEVENTKFL